MARKRGLLHPKICVPLGGLGVIRTVFAAVSTTPTPVGEVLFGHDAVSLFTHIVVDAFNKVVVKADVIELIGHVSFCFTLLITRTGEVGLKN